MKLCLKDTCTNSVFSHLYCRNHQYLRADFQQKQKEKSEKVHSHDKFYHMIWDSQNHVCLECGEAIHDRFDSKYIHHVIEKRFQKFYPNLDLDGKWNGIILCWIHHDQVNLNIDKVPKVKALTLELKMKYFEYYQP